MSIRRLAKAWNVKLSNRAAYCARRPLANAVAQVPRGVDLEGDGEDPTWIGARAGAKQEVSPLGQQLGLARAWARRDDDVLVHHGCGASAFGSRLRPPRAPSPRADHSGNSRAFLHSSTSLPSTSGSAASSSSSVNVGQRCEVSRWLALQLELGVVVIEQIQ